MTSVDYTFAAAMVEELEFLGARIYLHEDRENDRIGFNWSCSGVRKFQFCRDILSNGLDGTPAFREAFFDCIIDLGVRQSEAQRGRK